MGKQKRKRSPNSPLHPAELRLAHIATRGLEEEGQRYLVEMITANAIRIVFPKKPFPWEKYGPFMLVKRSLERSLEHGDQLVVYARLTQWFNEWRGIRLMEKVGIEPSQLSVFLSFELVKTLGTIVLARRVTYHAKHVFLAPFSDLCDEEGGTFDRAND